MESNQLQDFFFWCMVVNSGIYTFTAVAVSSLDEGVILAAVHRYLATYKLFITAFNFTPWIALLIISK